MAVKANLGFSAVILVIGFGATMVSAESYRKNADSITKDLVIEQTTAPSRSWESGSPSISDRGIQIVPVGVEQQNHGSGRTALSVEFNYDSDILTQDAKWQLDELAQALSSKALSGDAFEIIGHTDAVGSDEYNMGLSKRRAFSVVQYLNGAHRVSANRLYAVGRGERELADPQNPGSGVNRRVEVRNLGGE